MRQAATPPTALAVGCDEFLQASERGAFGPGVEDEPLTSSADVKRRQPTVAPEGGTRLAVHHSDETAKLQHVSKFDMPCNKEKHLLDDLGQPFEVRLPLPDPPGGNRKRDDLRRTDGRPECFQEGQKVGHVRLVVRITGARLAGVLPIKVESVERIRRQHFLAGVDEGASAAGVRHEGRVVLRPAPAADAQEDPNVLGVGGGDEGLEDRGGRAGVGELERTGRGGDDKREEDGV